MPRYRSAGKNNLFSILVPFVIYPLVACAAIILYRLIFYDAMDAARLLPVFRTGNKFALGFLDFCSLFPAIFMSALVIPFGKKQMSQSGAEIKYSRFSPEFLKLLQPSILAAIAAAVFYGILFLCFRPLVADYRVDIEVKSQIYRMAKEKMLQFGQTEAWDEASHFLAICDRIWGKDPTLEESREIIVTGLEKQTYGRTRNEQTKPLIDGIPGQRKPLNALEALQYSDQAYAEERYYDAHWLANLARQLAKDGSVESQNATLAASKAWNAIGRLEPQPQERKLFAVYREKREAYEAMNSEDWIRAYYIFMDLIEQVPNDPDVQNYLKMSEEGLKHIAFFLDEIESHVGSELVNPVFSIPMWELKGRLVMRAASIASTADFIYGKGLEIIAFDEMRRPVFRVAAPYIKILPVTLGNVSRTVVYLRALDRYDETKHWDPTWTGDTNEISGGAQILLDIPFDEFLLASVAGQNYEDFFLSDLWNCARTLSNYGYIPAIFQAEVLRNCTEPLTFLPLAMFAIIIGWTLRARGRARYIYYPMFIILPLVFNAFVEMTRQIFYGLQVCALLALGFGTALPLCIAVAALLFIISLLGIAAQHG
jgi:hypothetical protein